MNGKRSTEALCTTFEHATLLSYEELAVVDGVDQRITATINESMQKIGRAARKFATILTRQDQARLGRTVEVRLSVVPEPVAVFLGVLDAALKNGRPLDEIVDNILIPRFMKLVEPEVEDGEA